MNDRGDDTAGGAPLVVVMGVAGCGKTTVGRALAQALGVPFVDADDLHPPANVDRMRRGLPLDDELRRPWLDAVHARLAAAAPQGLVVACSALKRAYRARLAQGLPALRFFHLHADRDTLAQRLQQRAGHFFAPHLLDDQLATLEPLAGEPPLDARAAPAELVLELVRRCRGPR